MGTLDHRGTTITSGHYVSKILSEEGQWLLCNDLSVVPISFEEVVCRDNYILLFKKKNKDSLFPDFIPSFEWQEMQPWQSVPRGCHVMMDISGSGRRMGRIIPDESSTSKDSVDPFGYMPKQPNKSQSQNSTNIASANTHTGDLEYIIETLASKENKTASEKKELKKLRERRRYQNMTGQQKELRRKQSLGHMHSVRADETEQEKELRRKQDMEHKQYVRADETEQEKESRRKQNMEHKQSVRANETEQEKESRRQQDREHKEYVRDDETEQEKEARNISHFSFCW